MRIESGNSYWLIGCRGINRCFMGLLYPTRNVDILLATTSCMLISRISFDNVGTKISINGQKVVVNSCVDKRVWLCRQKVAARMEKVISCHMIEIFVLGTYRYIRSCLRMQSPSTCICVRYSWWFTTHGYARHNSNGKLQLTHMV